MKTMKKAFALLLALALVFTLAIPAFAAAGGTITMNNPKVGETYYLYKLFDLSYDDGTKAFKYTITEDSDWYAFFAKAATSETDSVTTDGAGSAYITLKPSATTEKTYIVTWTDDAKTAADLAVLTAAYAADKKLSPLQTKTCTEPAEGQSPSLVFDGLDTGYYMISSTVGTLVALETNNMNATVYNKNPSPTVDKDVKEDSSGEWRDYNNADYAQEVEYRATLRNVNNMKHLEFHDTMTGLTLNRDSIRIKLSADNSAAAPTVVDPSNYTVYIGEAEYMTISTLPEGYQYDGCTFHIRFREDFLKSLTANSILTVYYTADVNQDAIISGLNDVNGNPNEIHLSYGNNQETETSKVITRVYAVDIFKWWRNSGVTEQDPLAGAKFILQKNVITAGADGQTVTTPHYAILAPHTETVEGSEDPVVTHYDLTGWTTTKDDATEFVSPEDGYIHIRGLDADTQYILVETAPPPGFNAAAPVPFTIEENGQLTLKGSTVSEIKIENRTGAELPSTGGMGTTLFYILGATLMLGAAVLLITKRRMRT